MGSGLGGINRGGFGDIETGVVRQQVKTIREGKTTGSDGRVRMMGD